MSSPSLVTVETKVETPRIFRQVGFDLETFDVLQDVKRYLENEHDRGRLPNASVLRCLVMSHPEALWIAKVAREGRG